MALELFRNYHVHHLRANVGANLARYADRKPWADKPSPAGPTPTS